MVKTATRLAAALAIGLLACQGANAAASIAGDTFGLSVTVDDGSGGTVTVLQDPITSLPFSGVAGAVADNYFSNADLLASFDVGGTGYDIRVNWVGARSVDVFVNAFGAADLYALSITLTGLNLTDGGQPISIVGAAFDRAASNVDSYNAGPGMPDPSVSFTAQSVTAAFSYFPGPLAADGPVLRFVVQAVPEPTAIVMLVCGLGVLVACGRRRG